VWCVSVPQRAAALAFYTLLSVVPILAATFALLSRFGGLAGSQAVVRFIADRYFPRATDAAIDAMTADLDVRAARRRGRGDRPRARRQARCAAAASSWFQRASLASPAAA